MKFSSVQSLSRVQLFVTPWTAARQASLSITNSRSLLKLMSIESVMPSSHLILCHPLLLPPSIFPSIRVFSTESVLCIRWPKYWSFSFRISLSYEYSGLISFRMDWLDLLAVQGTLKSLLQPQVKSINSSSLSFLYCPALTSIHDYWKNHSFNYMDLCRQSKNKLQRKCLDQNGTQFETPNALLSSFSLATPFAHPQPDYEDYDLSILTPAPGLSCVHLVYLGNSFPLSTTSNSFSSTINLGTSHCLFSELLV